MKIIKFFFGLIFLLTHSACSIENSSSSANLTSAIATQKLTSPSFEADELITIWSVLASVAAIGGGTYLLAESLTSSLGESQDLPWQTQVILSTGVIAVLVLLASVDCDNQFIYCHENDDGSKSVSFFHSSSL